MNRCISISEYGQDCYTDCRPCERERAEEHFDDEMGYDLCGETVIGYNLTDMKEINDKAYQLVQEEVVQEHIADYAAADIHSDKFVKSIGKDGLYNWKWSFDANIPNPNKKRRFTKSKAVLWLRHMWKIS